jgi:hypothetical protein
MKRIFTLAAGLVVALVVPVQAEDILLNGQEGNAPEEGVIVTDKATLDRPEAPPEGIPDVMVSGVLVVNRQDDGRALG